MPHPRSSIEPLHSANRKYWNNSSLAARIECTCFTVGSNLIQNRDRSPQSDFITYVVIVSEHHTVANSMVVVRS